MSDPSMRMAVCVALVTACTSTRGCGSEEVAQAPSAVMDARLRAALQAKGPTYSPRTHHLLPDGGPKYANRLIEETSPYLLQHAHNPVNWYAWGDEAFARAQREGKPVLLSIGYSTCHWCHVMERESFEDEEIARYLNENYIAIKVDREERPDLDDTYMKAVQMLAGNGGWPMTVMLTPDRLPFFGGTYFPARDGDRGARKGFLSILKDLKHEFEQAPHEVAARAQQLSLRIAEEAREPRPATIPGFEVIDRSAQGAAQSFDATWGGFGRAPKFPRPAALELLLRHHKRTGDAHALRMVVTTLEKMAAGGLYDQIGGGFHRYSTDAQWLAPHFEKMLYDNAQLVPVYLSAYQLTGRAELADIARQTLQYVAREMTAPAGAFYSATDADSRTPTGHDEEGFFFTWTPAEIERVVGELGDTIARAKSALYEARSRRPAPLRDDKILTSWNGLMISAFAQACLVLADSEYATRAAAAADFILREMRGSDGRLRRSFNAGRAGHPGFLDDYAFFIQGLLDLYECSSEPKWLQAALALQGRLDEHHWDETSGAYFTTSDDQPLVVARDKPSYDGAEPSGNSVALLNLLRLAELTTRDDLRARAARGLAALSQPMSRAPAGSPKLLCALDFYLGRPREVLIVAPEDGADTEPLVARFRRAFACERGRCGLPTSNPETFAKQLAEL